MATPTRYANARLDSLRKEIRALRTEASRPQGLSRASYASLRALADELGAAHGLIEAEAVAAAQREEEAEAVATAAVAR